MANKLLIKRGTRAKLPTLAVGEPGFCTDTKELFVGSESGNVQYFSKEQVMSLMENKADKGKQVSVTLLNGWEINVENEPVQCYTVDNLVTISMLIKRPQDTSAWKSEITILPAAASRVRIHGVAAFNRPINAFLDTAGNLILASDVAANEIVALSGTYRKAWGA